MITFVSSTHYIPYVHYIRKIEFTSLVGLDPSTSRLIKELLIMGFIIVKIVSESRLVLPC